MKEIEKLIIKSSKMLNDFMQIAVLHADASFDGRMLATYCEKVQQT
jgi:hypothetical protein